MKVVFLSPQFDNILTGESSYTSIENAVEVFMKDRFDISSDTFINIYGEWSVYTEKEYNLYYQGTVAELLPPIW